jgi:hypothetical protein
VSQSDLARFRAMCGQFRWLAVFMVVTVGGLLALLHLIFPAMIVICSPHPLSSTCSRSGLSAGRWAIWRAGG